MQFNPTLTKSKGGEWIVRLKITSAGGWLNRKCFQFSITKWVLPSSIVINGVKLNFDGYRKEFVWLINFPKFLYKQP